MKVREIYIGLTLLIIGFFYFLFQFNPFLLSKIINYWSIFIIIAGIFLELLAFHEKKSILPIISGVLIISGIMYFIDMFINCNYFAFHIGIILLSLAGGLLNYYTFNYKSVFILPFIFLLIFTSVIMFSFPLYEKYIPVFTIETLFSIGLIFSGIFLIVSGIVKDKI